MTGYVADIEELTEENTDFRQVLYTGKNIQLVLICLQPGEEIGEETHVTHDQFFRIEEGKGIVTINDKSTKIKKDYAIIIPAGAKHNIANNGHKAMRLYTLYAPPQHRDGFVAETRDQGIASPEKFDGKTTE